MEGIEIFWNSFFVCVSLSGEMLTRNEIPIDKNTSHLFLSLKNKQTNKLTDEREGLRFGFRLIVYFVT